MQNLNNYNSYYINENKSIPPISSLYPSKYDEGIQIGYCRVTIYPIFGSYYYAIIAKDIILNLLVTLDKLNHKFSEFERQIDRVYYDKLRTPFVGKILASPIAERKRKAFSEFEVVGRNIHNQIQEIVYENMPENELKETLRLSRTDNLEFQKHLNKMGYDV